MEFPDIGNVVSGPARKGVIALVVLAVTTVLFSAPGNPFTKNHKAYYADPNWVNFVRPGLVIDVLGAEIAADGTIRARFKLTDPQGVALDRLGIYTPGPISVTFIAAYIPNGKTQYVAYTTRTQVSPITGNSAIQASSQSNGLFQSVADGEYTYTFSIKAPADFDKTVTHTIGAYGSRNLSEFGMGTDYDDDTFSFVPNGAPVTVTRDVIRTVSCNKCHDQLALHGGPRRTMELCVLCHTPQTTDPDTGRSVDMVEIAHKIHTGSSLPSVMAGNPYIIIGNNQSVHDYSKVVFPPDVRNCIACHEPGKGAAQESACLNPTRQACGSCHDDVNFATGEGHVNLPQVSDNLCAGCHVPEGEIEFDASIKGAHTIPEQSRMLPGTVFNLVSIADAAPGKRPAVTFDVRNNNGEPIDISQMARLALVLSGPTTDYTTYVSEDPRQAISQGGGRYVWTFQQALPAEAKGSFTIGIEGYQAVTLLPGTQQEIQDVRDAGVNKVIHFAVDGGQIEPRRQVVSLEKCNACHFRLSLHGGNRNAIEQCVLCHNPRQTDDAVRPSHAGPATTIDLRMLVHQIHTGRELEYDYTVYGRGGTPHNYNGVGYPGDRRNCGACHINDSEQLPAKETMIEVTNPNGYLNPVGPTAAACTSCHTSVYAASHALANTNELGESCAVCHGPNSQYSVDSSHAR